MKLNRLRDIRSTRGADVVFVNRDLAGGGLFFERHLIRTNPHVVFDFDDAIYLGEKNKDVVRWICENAAWVTPGNAFLADWARQFSERVTVIPTVIDTDSCVARDWKAGGPAGPIRVGWTGSDGSIRTTLFPHLEMFREMQRKLNFELVVISNTKPSLPVSGIRWSFHPWNAELDSRLADLFDVGIMPLVDDMFQRGKCGLKLLQCMAAGLPTIASPVGVNAEIIEEGVTGFAAANLAAWQSALSELVDSPDLRARMGEAGRKRCVADYSVHRWLPVLDDVLCRAAGPVSS